MKLFADSQYNKVLQNKEDLKKKGLRNFIRFVIFLDNRCNMDIFEKIAECKILEAMKEGIFENLSGKGRPLVFEDETCLPAGRQGSLKISGFLAGF